ncbi:MAG: lysostaphin resistance A-like protein [Ruminococcus callidus]
MANFFLSLLPLVGFFAVQILVSVVVVVIMVFVNAFQSGRTQNVMAAYEEIVSASIPVATALAHLVSAVGFAFWYRLSFQKPRPATGDRAGTETGTDSDGAGTGHSDGCIQQRNSRSGDPAVPRMVEDTYAMLERSGIGTNGLVIFATVCLAPIGEELVFRGLTMKYAEKAFGRFWAANLLQAFLFGVIHMNWVQGVYAFFGGLVLGWVAHRYRSVVFSMLMHFAVNSFSTFGGDYLLGWIPLNFITATLLVVIPAAIAIGLIAWRNDAAEKTAPSGGTLPPQGQC